MCNLKTPFTHFGLFYKMFYNSEVIKQTCKQSIRDGLFIEFLLF